MTGLRPAFLTIAFLMAVVIFTSYGAAAASTVYGNVYEWSTLGLVTNATIELDSASGIHQQKVANAGNYSFTLAPGEYVLIARAGSGQDMLYARENITIGDEDIVLDLILFPYSDLTDLGLLDEEVDITVPEEPAADNTLLLIAGGFIAIAALAGCVVIVAFIFLRKKKEVLPPEVEEAEEDIIEPIKVQPGAMADLSEDLKQVIAIVEKNGGRITQLDLRKSLPYSEAKVSLMITDLESRGILRKVKKGRGNVIILNKEDDRK